jgi:hypothetical protein
MIVWILLKNYIAVEQAPSGVICLVNPNVIVSEKVFERALISLGALKNLLTEQKSDNRTTNQVF